MNLHKIETTKFGQIIVDVDDVKRKRGLNSRIEGLIKIIKNQHNVKRLSSEEFTTLYTEIQQYFIKL